MYLVESISRIFPRIKPLFNFATFLLSYSPHDCPKKMVVIRIRNDWNARLESIFASFCRLFVQPRDCGTLRGSKVTLMFGNTSLCVFCGLWKNKVLSIICLFEGVFVLGHTMYFFYLIQFCNRLYMYVVLRRNRLNRNLRWLSTMEYAISLARSRKKIEEENL